MSFKIKPPRPLAPLYTHDCEACRFLGTITDVYTGGDTIVGYFVDLYHCPNSVVPGGSLIARHGDRGPEYSSSPVKYVSLTGDGPLPTAKHLWQRIVAREALGKSA